MTGGPHSVWGDEGREAGEYESFQGRVWGEFVWTKRKTRGSMLFRRKKPTLYHGGPIPGFWPGCDGMKSRFGATKGKIYLAL